MCVCVCVCVLCVCVCVCFGSVGVVKRRGLLRKHVSSRCNGNGSVLSLTNHMMMP